MAKYTVVGPFAFKKSKKKPNSVRALKPVTTKSESRRAFAQVNASTDRQAAKRSAAQARREAKREAGREYVRRQYGIGGKGYGARKNPLMDILSGRSRTTTPNEKKLTVDGLDILGRKTGVKVKPYGSTTLDTGKQDLRRIQKEVRSGQRGTEKPRSTVDKLTDVARILPGTMQVVAAKDAIGAIAHPHKTAKAAGNVASTGVKLAKKLPYDPELASIGAGPGHKRAYPSPGKGDNRLVNTSRAFGESQVGAAKGYYHHPKDALKGDAKAGGTALKGLTSGAFISAATHPNQTLDLLIADYKRRYNNGNPKGASKNAQKIVEKEGGLLTYGADLATAATAAGKGVGAIAKATGTDTSLGRLVNTPRPKLRTSQGVVRAQRRDESMKAAPNVFRSAAQKLIDRHRAKSFDKRERRATSTAANKRQPLRPREGEVVHSSGIRRSMAQKKDAARVKGQNLLNMKREMSPALKIVNDIISERPGKGLNKHERKALSMVYEGIVPNDPKAAIAFLEKRKKDITENRKGSTPAAVVEHDRLTKEIGNAEYAKRDFERRLKEAVLNEEWDQVGHAKNGIAHWEGVASDLRGQLDNLGPTRKASSRGEPTRFQMDTDELNTIDHLIKHADQAFTPAVGEAAEKLRKVDASAAKGSDALPTARKVATRYGPQAHVLGLERADGESLAQFALRVNKTAKEQGLSTPGYLPHVSKAGEVEAANYAVGGAEAINYKTRTLDNFKEGRVDRSPEAIREGVAKTIKVKHNHELVKQQFERHANPEYSNMPLSTAVQKMDADGIDPGEVRIWFPGKFKGEIKETDVGTHGADVEGELGTLSDNVKNASVELAPGRAGLEQAKALAAKPEFKDQQAVVVDKAVYDEILSSTHPSGVWGRSWDIINAKTARAILGTGNVGWLAVDALSGAAGNAIGGVIPLGPTWWKAQHWYHKLSPEQKSMLDNELGIHPRMDYAHQPKLGSAVENMPPALASLVNGWNAWRGTPIGKLRPIGKPIDLFMAAEGKIAVEPFRKAAAYNVLKKTARKGGKGDMSPEIGILNAATDKLVDVLKLGDKERINKLLENPEIVEQVGRSVDNLLGDWMTKTNAERKVLGRAGFFYPYMRYSLRMLFYTMPLEHPITTAVLAKLGQFGAEEVKELMGGEDIPWGLGKVYSKDGKKEWSLLKRANFFNNAAVGAQSSENLTGVLPPALGMALSQIMKENVYTGQDWTTDGNPSWNDKNTNIWHRAQIAAADIADLPFITRIAGNVLSSGQKQSSDSIPLIGKEKPLQYTRQDKIDMQARRKAEKNASGTFEQIGQAIGFLPKPSHDREMALAKKKPPKAKKAESTNPLDRLNKALSGGKESPLDRLDKVLGGGSGEGTGPTAPTGAPTSAVPAPANRRLAARAPRSPAILKQIALEKSAGKGGKTTVASAAKISLKKNGNAIDPAEAAKKVREAPRLGKNNTDLRRYARKQAMAAGLDPDFFEAQIQQENGFKTQGTSPKGAQGIAQIMPGTAQSWKVDPNDPKAALKSAAKHMATYYKQYGGKTGPKASLNQKAINNALAAYNGGPGVVGRTLPSETQAYIKNINSMARKGNSANPITGGTTSGGSAPRNVNHAAKKILAHTGLKETSTWRSKAHNAEVGGVENSYHTRGSKSNPQAGDFVGSQAEMEKGKKIAQKAGMTAFIHDAGSGMHLHIQNDHADVPATNDYAAPVSGPSAATTPVSASAGIPSRKKSSRHSDLASFFDTPQGRIALLDFINSKSKNRTQNLISALRAA